MTILVKDTAINVERFIAAEVVGCSVRVYMDGLLTPGGYISISTCGEDVAKDLVKIIHKKMEKRLDKSSSL